LSCGGLRFTVMHVPGHAPGLVAFNGEGISFGGDLLFAGSIGRTDLPLGSPADMNASLVRYSTLPEETIVYPGHGPSTTIGREKRTNPFLTGAARLVQR
jgi:hydroxyacylglutathione hydrolase